MLTGLADAHVKSGIVDGVRRQGMDIMTAQELGQSREHGHRCGDSADHSKRLVDDATGRRGQSAFPLMGAAFAARTISASKNEVGRGRRAARGSDVLSSVLAPLRLISGA